MKPILEIKNISKKYQIHTKKHRYLSLRDQLVARLKNLTNSTPSTSFWALQDIELDIFPGDTVGIVGKNGAGKSTLLKIISRITPPTTGKIIAHGRIASLLEVGTGFHPELTGRENIFLNGSILGLKKTEIISKFEEIVAFSGVEQFLDVPLKHYSSGMQLRLAFSVAAHLEPEILIVDEVLAVGDAEFQKKCIGKMEDISSNHGRTVLMVSHNMGAIQSLTQKGIFLKKGQLAYWGSSKEAIAQYLSDETQTTAYHHHLDAPTDPYISAITIDTSLTNNIHLHGDPMDIVFEIDTPISVKSAAISFYMLDLFKRQVTHILNLSNEQSFCEQPGKYRLTAHLPNVRLYPGTYTLAVHFADAHTRKKYETIHDVCTFEVQNKTSRDYYWYPNGAVYIEDHQWSVTKL